MVRERFVTGEGEGGVLSSSLVGGSAFRTWGSERGFRVIVGGPDLAGAKS